MDAIVESIRNYLNQELEKDLQKEVSQIKNPTEKIIENKRLKLAPKFEYTSWLNSFFSSLAFMQEQTLSFATHTSKGIHSVVKSDNVIFLDKGKLPKHLIGSDSIESLPVDANSNNTGSHAGHLKIIVNFLNIKINDKYFYDFIIDNDKEFSDFFMINKFPSFFSFLRGKLTENIKFPISDSRNKQLLFPLDMASNYVCIVPLYPSSLSNHLFHRVNKTQKETRIIRKNKQIKMHTDLLDLATVRLGGENAQNVSRLNNTQKGSNYLLPSLPPPSLAKRSNNTSFIPSKFSQSIFNGKRLKYLCENDIKKIFSVVEDTRNNIDIRDKRKEALDAVLHNIFSLAETMRTALPAGWSKDYKELETSQKYWLDPLRAELDGEEEFAKQREQGEWITVVISDFALWLNTLLKAQFPKYKADFSDAEHIEWEREIEDMKKQYERAGKGVFL